MKFNSKLITFFLISLPLMAAEVPSGFTEAEIAKMKMGEILVKEENTKTDYVGVYRGYIDGASAEAYEKLITDHPSLTGMFKEIKEAKTLKSNDAKSEFDYWIKMRVNLGPISIYFEPEINQVIKNPKDVAKEWTIQNTISNYQEDIKLGRVVDRIIPYEKGILVEQTAVINLHEATLKTSTVKDQVAVYFKRLLPAFKKALKG